MSEKIQRLTGKWLRQEIFEWIQALKIAPPDIRQRIFHFFCWHFSSLLKNLWKTVFLQKSVFQLKKSHISHVWNYHLPKTYVAAELIFRNFLISSPIFLFPIKNSQLVTWYGALHQKSPSVLWPPFWSLFCRQSPVLQLFRNWRYPESLPGAQSQSARYDQPDESQYSYPDYFNYIPDHLDRVMAWKKWGNAASEA